MRQESDNDARLEFNCGKSTGTIQIDDIALVEAVELGVAPPARFIPSDVAASISGNERVTVAWYDHAGRLIRNVSGEFGTVMQQQKGARLPGSCVAVIRCGDRKIIRKMVAVVR
jgi:hypothetical protein